MTINSEQEADFSRLIFYISISGHYIMIEKRENGGMAIWFTELYMLLPVMLWLLGWLHVWIAVPLVMSLVYLLTAHAVALRKYGVEGIRCTPWQFVIYALISAVAVFLIGFDGRVMQAWDLIVRNPIYSELIQSEWPVIMPDGRVVMYALMFWLPPALVSKLNPEFATLWIQVWCFMGAMLMLLNVHGTLGLWKTLLLTLGISCFMPLSALVDDGLNVIFHIDAIMAAHFRLPAAATQWCNTFHYFIIGGLWLTATTERKLPTSVYVLISALFACLHPILASVVFPLVVYKVYCAVGGWKGLLSVFKMPEVYIGGILVIIFLLYYSSGGTCWWAFTLDAPYAPQWQPWVVYILGIVLAMLPPFLVWWSTKCGIMLLWMAWCPVIISCWYGETNGVNEWMYKFTVLYSFYIVYYLVRYIERKRVKWVVGVLLICSALSFLRMVERSQIIVNAMNGFVVDEKNLQSGWKNSLYHPENHLYVKLTSEQKPAFFIFR